MSQPWPLLSQLGVGSLHIVPLQTSSRLDCTWVPVNWGPSNRVVWRIQQLKKQPGTWKGRIFQTVICNITPRSKVSLLECGRMESKCKGADLLASFLCLDIIFYMGVRKSILPLTHRFKPLFSFSHKTKTVMWSMTDKHQRDNFCADKSESSISFDFSLFSD